MKKCSAGNNSSKPVATGSEFIGMRDVSWVDTTWIVLSSVSEKYDALQSGKRLAHSMEKNKQTAYDIIRKN